MHVTSVNDLLNVAAALLVVEIVDVVVVRITKVQRVVITDDVPAVDRLTWLVCH